MQAVILAAGKGSRLHPITTSISKAMLPVLGKPIVERVMESIASCGVGDFILVISPTDDEIRAYFENESELDIDLHFAYQPERLGMADALMQAVPLIKKDFILSACDNLVSLEDVRNLISGWKMDQNLDGLLAVIRIPQHEMVRSGMVTMEGDRVTDIVEKPSLDLISSDIASMPLYCFSPRILDFLSQTQLSPRGEHELQDAIQMLIQEGGDVRGCFFQKRFALTTPRDLLEINQHYLESNKQNWQNKPMVVGPGTQLIEPLYIEDGAIIGAGCNIGPNVYIGKNARVGNNVRLRNVVVLEDAFIMDHLDLFDQLVT